MEGFVKNETGKAVFKAQRPLPPGAKFSFEDAYLVFEQKSGKQKGTSFIKWLRDNVFPEEGWVFYKEEGVPFFSPKKIDVKKEEPVVAPVAEKVVPDSTKKVAPGKGAGRRLIKKTTKVARSNNTAAAIIEAQLPQAKSLIEQTKDRQVLKKALSLSNHFANKEEHRRLIQRRLQEVY